MQLYTPVLLASPSIHAHRQSEPATASLLSMTLRSQTSRKADLSGLRGCEGGLRIVN